MEFIFYLIVGFALLIVAGELLVRGAVSIAAYFGIPSLVIGLTIVAFGTSAPELVISLKAALTGHGDIAVGNVVGSNIANILIVLGLPAILKAIPCDASGTLRNAAFMVFATAVFIVFSFFQPFTIWHGLVFLALLAIFLGDSVVFSRKNRTEATDGEVLEGRVDNLALASGMLILGLIGLPLGGNLAVDGAVGLAKLYGVSEAAIGLTIVALGTSLPELFTGLIAARRGHTELAMGNVIGSNVFNILAILGITALITPVYAPARIVSFDMWVMVGSSLFLLPFALYCLPITRRIGVLMVLSYIAYTYIVFRSDI
ncbi:MAG: calcium/sodium antiporter [Rhizobiales bacterium]|nr:calcium/sodium antiporter [Hyphomicrobiales bacterium]